MNESSSFQSAYPEDLPPGLEDPRRTARIIAVTSGKGGVGKTSVTTNLGIALAMRGAKVCIFDADTSLANINILLGITPQYTLEQFLAGEKTIDEVAVEGPRGLTIIPAASGIAEYADLDSAQRHKLVDALEELEDRYDYLLIDTAAGLGKTVLSFVQSAQYAVVVISPEPTSLTDAFAMVKALQQRQFTRPVYVLVNMVANFHNSMEVFKRFQGAVEKYLKTSVRYLGYITLDETVISSIHLQRPVIVVEPNAPASRCFHTIAGAIGKNFRFSDEPHSLSAYWKQQVDALPASTPKEPVQVAEMITDTTDAGQASIRPPAEPQTAVQYLEQEDTTEADAEAFLTPLIETFVERFQSFPDVRKYLYRALEMQDFPDVQLRDLMFTLESLYEKRYQRPLRDIEDSIIKLFADVNGSEGKILELRRRLEMSYERQFGKRLFDAEAELIENVHQTDYDESRFDKLLQELKKTYRERFDKPHRDERDAVLEDVRNIAMRMEKQEASLRNGLTRLSEWFTDTVAAREELMDRMNAPAKEAADNAEEQE